MTWHLFGWIALALFVVWMVAGAYFWLVVAESEELGLTKRLCPAPLLTICGVVFYPTPFVWGWMIDGSMELLLKIECFFRRRRP